MIWGRGGVEQGEVEQSGVREPGCSRQGEGGMESGQESMRMGTGAKRKRSIWRSVANL